MEEAGKTCGIIQQGCGKKLKKNTTVKVSIPALYIVPANRLPADVPFLLKRKILESGC